MDETTIRVRFSEVDSMQVVWHGEYVKYLEDGRESFGRRYGLGYMDMASQGYVVPIVEMNIQYKHFLRYEEKIRIETHYIPTEAAKIKFDYFLYSESEHILVATAQTVQVFVNIQTRELELNNPAFYLDWKEKWQIR